MKPNKKHANFHSNERNQKFHPKLSGTDRSRAVAIGPEGLISLMRQTFGETSSEVYRAETMYADFCFHCWRELLVKHSALARMGAIK